LKFLLSNAIQITSYFIRKNKFEEFYTKSPEFVKIAPVDDEAIVRFCAVKGEMIFIPEIMSCYRIHSIGSWTSTNDSDGKKMEKHYIGLKKMIESFDSYTDYKYMDIIKDDIIDKEWKISMYGCHYRQIMQRKFKKFRRKLGLKQKVKFFLLALIKD
jgi:GR25 family glycosyltransferase involved in LPS biosynthesis